MLVAKVCQGFHGAKKDEEHCYGQNIKFIVLLYFLPLSSNGDKALNGYPNSHRKAN